MELDENTEYTLLDDEKQSKVMVFFLIMGGEVYVGMCYSLYNVYIVVEDCEVKCRSDVCDQSACVTILYFFYVILFFITKVDEALKERNNYYRGYRNAGTILPPHIYLVKPGTFQALKDYIVAHSSASYNQFKVPRKLKTTDTLKLMLDSRL